MCLQCFGSHCMWDRQRKLTCSWVRSRNGLNSSGGFCAGSHIVVDHQRINSTSFVFSAVVRPFLQSPPRGASTSFGRRRPFSAPCGRTSGSSGPCLTGSTHCRRDNYTLARRLAYHPHPPAFSRPVVICDPEGSEPRNSCSARATVVRYRR